MKNFEVRGYLKKDDKRMGFMRPILAKSIPSAYSRMLNEFKEEGVKSKVYILMIREIGDTLTLKLGEEG